jgi:hypothetical protein
MTSRVIRTDVPAVAGPPQGHWIYADWEILPDDGNRYEIIDMDRPAIRSSSWYTGRGSGAGVRVHRADRPVDVRLRPSAA